MKIPGEDGRVEALSSYKIMDSEHDVEFDDFIQMVVKITKASVATIAFADDERVWFKASHGIGLCEIPRENALCNHTISSKQLTHVPDLSQDTRFSDHEITRKGYRFYASFPLISKAHGFVIGTICILDKNVMTLSEEQLDLLNIIARQIMGFVEIREVVKNQKSLVQKHAETLNLLKKQTDEFNVMSNNIGDVVWMMDPRAKKLIYVSKSYERIWERSCDLLYSGTHSLLTGVHADDLDKVSGALALQDDFNLEDNYRIVTPEGNIKWIHQRTFTVKDDAGDVFRVVGISSDITERKKTEDDLKVKSEQFETIVNNIPLLLTLYNDDMTYDWVNKTFENKFGWSIKDLREPGGFEKLLGQDIKTRVIENMKNPDGSEWAEYETPDINNEMMRTSWINVRLSSGKCIGIGQDITDKKRIENLLKEQQAKMVNAAKLSSLGEMAAGVAHEINNPLTIIMGSAQILKTLSAQKDIDPATLKDISDGIQSTIYRIAKIINGLKNFARDGEKEPFAKANLHQVIQETLGFCEARFRNNGVTLEYEPIQDLILDCRHIQVSQVILNLLNNAFDAVQPNLNKWVRLKIGQTDESAIITIQDSGNGIPNEIQEKIMQPFFTTKIVGKGTGLGLSLSKGLIEAHGGTLTLDTKAKNTTFVVTLPKIHKR